MRSNPFQPFISARGFALLDGGLATTLEARGHELDPVLWSAKLLREDPDAIRAVHRAFLDAGADCIITASYQASFPGFAQVGVEEAEAVALLRRSSELARAARDDFLAARGELAPARARPLIAASVGPYGAYLADGSEYDGRYGVGRERLDAFHRGRLELLASTGVDLLACETIPSRLESEVLLGILGDQPDDVRAWMSFSCADGSRLHDGTPIEDVVGLCEGRKRIAAVGVNCTAPEHVAELTGRVRAVTDRPVIVYANSGEAYDAATGSWAGGAAAREVWLAGTLAARDAGADILGGCCRVGPEGIAELRRRLEAGP
jgi:homocysteine S-methyltransferase